MLNTYLLSFGITVKVADLLSVISRAQSPTCTICCECHICYECQFHISTFWRQNVGPDGDKNGQKKAIFIPAKCFVFDQSSCTIYLTWYWLLLFFQEFSPIIPFMVWLQDSTQIKGGGTFLCLATSVNIWQKYFFWLKTKYPTFHFLDLGGTILNLI